MKDQYVGDIGDYIKYALLRAIIKAEPNKKLGVAWYLTLDDGKSDGLHTGYLHAPEKWRCLDEKVFDALNELICCDGTRSVDAIKESGLLKNTVFFDEELQKGRGKANFRKEWSCRLQKYIEAKKCDIIFTDPDNGIENPCRNTSYSEKHITLQEVVNLVHPDDRTNRIGIFYHHPHRSKKDYGHAEQIKDWCDCLAKACCSEKGKAEVVALHWRAYSARTFFIVNPTPAIKNALKELEAKEIKNSGGKSVIELYGFNE